MFSITTKSLLIFSNIVLLIAVKVNSTVVSLKKLSLGDTVNKKNLTETSAEVYGNIINFNQDIPLIVKSLTKSTKNPPTWSITQFTCSKPLNSVFDNSVGESNSFEVFKKQKLNYKSFDIDKKYLTIDHMCMLFELCKFEKKAYNYFVSLFDKEFENYYDHYYYYNQNRNNGKHIDILKFIRGNETHYVSSINNGDCLFQIFVFKAEPEDTADKSLDYTEKSPQYSSKIIMSNGYHTIEKRAMEYLNNLDDFLFHFANYSPQNKSEILNLLAMENVMSIGLTPLPKLPRSLEFKQIKTELPKERTNLLQLQIGDSFNINDIQSDSILTNGNLLDFTYYLNSINLNLNRYQITNYSDIGMEKSLLPCRKFITKHYSDNNKIIIEKLKPFDCWLEEKSYGIDSEFFNKNYKRIGIKICATHEEKKVDIDSLEIVYLNQKSIDLDYNIFDNENVILRFQKGNETHYVSSIQTGDCVFQALVFNLNEDSDKGKPIYKGNILSASRDSELERTIEAYFGGDVKTDQSLFQIYSNETLENEIIKQLDRKTAVLNLDLQLIYKKRSPPLLDFNEYNSLKNSPKNLSVKNSETLSQELLTTIFQNLSQPNEAFKTFSQDLFTGMFKNLSHDLFPGVISKATENTSIEIPTTSSQGLIDHRNSSHNSTENTSAGPNSSNSLHPLLNLTTMYILLISCFFLIN